VIGELLQAGMLTADGGLQRQDDAPAVLRELDAKALAFEDPIGRQELLRLLYRCPSVRESAMNRRQQLTNP